MKKIIALIFPILLACSSNKVENSESVDTDSINESSSTKKIGSEIGPLSFPDVENYKIYEPGDTTIIFPDIKISSDSIEEQNALKTDSRVARVAEGLRFQLKNGESKLLKENKETDGDDFHQYVFQHSLDDVGQWLVVGGYYESFDYVLIDQQDGTENHLWGFPVLSPDKKYFLSSMVDLEAGFVPNGIQLWSIEDYKPTLLWQTELTDWGSDKLIWADDNLIFAEQTFRDEISGELKTRIIKMYFVQDME